MKYFTFKNHVGRLIGIAALIFVASCLPEEHTGPQDNLRKMYVQGVEIPGSVDADQEILVVVHGFLMGSGERFFRVESAQTSEEDGCEFHLIPQVEIVSDISYPAKEEIVVTASIANPGPCICRIKVEGSNRIIRKETIIEAD